MPEISALDLSAIDPVRFLLLLLAVSAVRMAIAIGAAVFVGPNTFRWDKVGEAIPNLILFRVLPVFSIAAIAQAIPDGPAHATVWLAACALLGLYVVESIKVAATNWVTGNPATPSS